MLLGARESLPYVGLIEAELSITALYESQPIIRDMLSALADFGFELILLKPGFSDTRTGKLLEVDGAFARPKPNGR